MRQGHRGYYVVDGISYHEDVIMPSKRRLAVPIQLRDQVLIGNHDAPYAGQFSAMIGDPELFLSGHEG